jgi:hypothetical protein
VSSKLSTLTAATTPLTGAELMYVVQGGVSKQVASVYLGPRELLTANRTYYVRTDGNDSNTGLVNSSGGAWLTIQHGVDVITSALDIGAGVVITLSVQSGTYAEGVSVRPWVGPGVVLVQGDTTTPSNVIVQPPSDTPCFQITGSFPGVFRLGGFQLDPSGTDGFNIGIYVAGAAGVIEVTGKMVYAATGANGAHIYLQDNISFYIYADYEITGGAANHVAATSGAIFFSFVTVTVTGTPAFSDAFVLAETEGVQFQGNTAFSGSATGKRFIARYEGILNTAGGGASFFPGDVAGDGTNPGASPYGLYI